MDHLKYAKKSKYVFHTHFFEIEIYWRLLSLEEFKLYSKLLLNNEVDPSRIEDLIYREIVLNNKAIDEMNTYPPGIVPSIVYACIATSGHFIRTIEELELLNDDLIRARADFNIYDEIIAIICKAFQSYTPTEIERLEYPEILRLLVMAEKILGFEEPIQFLPPKKKKGILDQAFEDAKIAESSDQRPPPERDIRDIIKERMASGEFTPSQARQMEMVKRLKERKFS